MTSVYEPREDSHLLAECVAKLAKGRVLDIGTGSGIQALTALEKKEVTRVTAVDINPRAVAFVRESLTSIAPSAASRMIVLEGDMFGPVQDEKFDTIICNPPYLPDEENDNDPALYGGQQGYEWSIRFLNTAPKHLAEGGQIIFLFSSLTNRERIDLELRKLHLLHEELRMSADFFERLYVYRIWSPA